MTAIRKLGRDFLSHIQQYKCGASMAKLTGLLHESLPQFWSGMLRWQIEGGQGNDESGLWWRFRLGGL